MQNELLLLRSAISFPLYLLASTPTRSCITEWHFLCIFLQCTYQVLHGRISYERLLAICIRQQILRASPQALNTWPCTGNDEWGRAAVKSIASTARLHFAEPNQHVFTFLHPILFCRVAYWAPFKFCCKSISTGAQYMTPDSKIYRKKSKMCRFSSGNWFFCTKFVLLAWLLNGATHLCTSKKECNKLDLVAPQ